MLDDLVARLPEGERRLLQLHLEGYTAVELAGRLGMGADAVRQRLHRIRLKLKQFYTKYYEDR